MAYTDHAMLQDAVHERSGSWNGEQVVTMRVDMVSGTVRWTSDVHSSDYSEARIPAEWSVVYPVVYNANSNCRFVLASSNDATVVHGDFAYHHAPQPTPVLGY